MRALEEFKLRLQERLRSEALYPSCLRVVDFVIDTPDDELRSISFATIAKAAGFSEIDEKVMSIVAIIRNTKPKVLDINYYYITDHEEYEVDLSTALKAISSGTLVDRFGNEITDAADKLFPFFSISDDFKKLKSSHYD